MLLTASAVGRSSALTFALRTGIHFCFFALVLSLFELLFHTKNRLFFGVDRVARVLLSNVFCFECVVHFSHLHAIGHSNNRKTFENKNNVICVTRKNNVCIVVIRFSFVCAF